MVKHTEPRNGVRLKAAVCLEQVLGAWWVIGREEKRGGGQTPVQLEAGRDEVFR